jgi:glycosyltransferase involved in cell wall biosynthesis
VTTTPVDAAHPPAMTAISVIVPTCNRPSRVRSLLANLRESTHALREVLIVDSSDPERRLSPAELLPFDGLNVRWIAAPRSVCVQRNIGIARAEAPWVFLCDDDIEVPRDYLSRLVAHLEGHPECGAVSGVVLERRGDAWVGQQPETSALVLLWKLIFEMGIWGEIRADSMLGRSIGAQLRRRGNHLSRAGWPVITEMAGPYFRTPIYGLGASVVRREWLLRSPYDESLDSHGIGDNYGVAIGFPPEGIHVVTTASVHHHRDEENRLPAAVAHERRLLALHHFIRDCAGEVPAVSRPAFLWSLLGSAILHGMAGNKAVARASWKTFGRLALSPLLGGGGADAGTTSDAFPP